jgi:hypothetical protein
MRFIIVLTLLNISFAIGNSKIKCDFTEPFVTLIVDLENSALTTKGHLVLEESIYVDLQLKGHQLDVYSQETGKLKISVIADIGDAGMSDLLYPLKAIWNGHHGGCSIGRHQPIGAMNAFEDIIQQF